MKKFWFRAKRLLTPRDNSIDFTSPIKQHAIVTDATEREQGQSHASFSFQNGIVERKHYFLAHLEPQPNGAAFASVLLPFKPSLAMDDCLRLYACGLTMSPAKYQLLLGTPASRRNRFSYQQTFYAQWGPYQCLDFPLSAFQPYFRGRYMPQAPALVAREIDTVGFRVVGRNRSSDGVMGYQKGLYGLALRELSIKSEM